jgi:hypothetical protein
VNEKTPPPFIKLLAFLSRKMNIVKTIIARAKYKIFPKRIGTNPRIIPE